MKKFSKFEKTAIMNAAKASYILVEKKDKLSSKLTEEREKMEKKFAEKTAKIQAEIKANEELIEKFEAPILELTEGKHSYELVQKSIEDITDAQGNVSKRTKYTFIDEESTESEALTEASAPAEEITEASFTDEVECDTEVNSSENSVEVDPFAE